MTSTTRAVLAVAVAAGLLAVSGRLDLPVPGSPVPQSAQTLVVLAAGLALGPWLGGLTILRGGLQGQSGFGAGDEQVQQQKREQADQAGKQLRLTDEYVGDFDASFEQRLIDHHIDRHSFVIVVGGGAVLDAVGLVAATTHRGVRLIRVPTTVLSQNDSGVGVKNGVNLQGVKNFIGTFAPPFAVLNDSDLIKDLPPREKIAGLAEAVKVALIRDGVFFSWLETHADDLNRLQAEYDTCLLTSKSSTRNIWQRFTQVMRHKKPRSLSVLSMRTCKNNKSGTK